MSDHTYRPTPEPLIETSPGVFEQARYRVIHRSDPKPGDTAWVYERQADGTWGPPRLVTVTDDTDHAGTTGRQEEQG
jgi:hypothetical protein